MIKEDVYQAKAPDPVPIPRDAFEAADGTSLYWLTGAGVFLNSRGTTILIDPILSLSSENPPLSEVENLPQYVMPPILAKDLGRVDAVLYTHSDPDHLGEITVKEMLKSSAVFHGTANVKERLTAIGVPEERIIVHTYKERFQIGCVDIQMTAADHPWQIDFPERNMKVFEPHDCCGYKFYTPDGVIWDPGDSKLLEEHFDNTDVDLLFMDFEDNSPLHHFGTVNALRLVNRLTQADIIMFHWGTYYAPDKPWYAADPAAVIDRIVRPERFLTVHPGEKIPVSYR